MNFLIALLFEFVTLAENCDFCDAKFQINRKKTSSNEIAQKSDDEASKLNEIILSEKEKQVGVVDDPPSEYEEFIGKPESGCQLYEFMPEVRNKIEDRDTKNLDIESCKRVSTPIVKSRCENKIIIPEVNQGYSDEVYNEESIEKGIDVKSEDPVDQKHSKINSTV